MDLRRVFRVSGLLWVLLMELHYIDNYRYICFVVHQAFTRYPHYFGSNAAAQGYLTARSHPGSLCPEHCKSICKNPCQSAAGRGGDMCGF